jgi:hypothetical protein
METDFKLTQQVANSNPAPRNQILRGFRFRFGEHSVSVSSSPSCREESSQTGQVSCGNQVPVNKIIEGGFKSMPRDR